MLARTVFNARSTRSPLMQSQMIQGKNEMHNKLYDKWILSQPV